MTRKEFREQLAEWGMSMTEFSVLVDMNVATVIQWGKRRHGRGVQVVPRWVDLLFIAWKAPKGPPVWLASLMPAQRSTANAKRNTDDDDSTRASAATPAGRLTQRIQKNKLRTSSIRRTDHS